MIARKAGILLVLVTLVQSSFAQDDLDNLLTESLEDGTKLIKGYVDPFMKSVSLGLNQGWYNTAKPHKFPGFDLTVTATAMTIPSSDLLYDVSKLNLQQVEMTQNSPGRPFAPTIFGPEISPIYQAVGNTDPNATFEGPEGLDLKENIGKNWMPVPMATLGIGLPKEIDLKLRISPSIDVGDNGKFKIFGIGVMHNVKQYIPGLKLLPFDLSGFVGYTRLSLDYQYVDGDVEGENQRGEFSMSATTIQGVISKKFSVVTVYGGAGYNIAKSNLGVKGTFVIDGETVENPVDLKFSASGPRITAGFRLKFAVFTLHADYTLQKYSALTAGFGINVR